MMTRIITIQGKEGRFDVPSFVLSENEDLHITINAPIARNGVYYYIVNHGEYTRRICLKGIQTVVLPAEWLNKGGTSPLISELELRDKTGVVVYRKYDIEPLEIRKAAVGMEYISGVQKVETENAELRVAFEALKRRFDALEARVSGYETNGVELIPEVDEEGE